MIPSIRSKTGWKYVSQHELDQMIKVKYPRKFVPPNGFNGAKISVEEYHNPIERDEKRARIRKTYADMSDNVTK